MNKNKIWVGQDVDGFTGDMVGKRNGPSLCNHLGQTKTAAVWSASAEQMLTEFVVQDIADCIIYMNVHFIQLHHNHRS